MRWLLLTYTIAVFLRHWLEGLFRANVTIVSGRIAELATTFQILNFTILLLAITLFLLALVALKVSTAFITDAAVFIAGYYLGEIIGKPFLVGLLFLSGRKSGVKPIEQAVSAAVIATIAAYISLAIDVKTTLVLMALLSVYDVLGVMVLKFIPKIWIGDKRSPSSSSTAIFFDERGIRVGAGDVLLPVIFLLQIPQRLVPLALLLFSASFFLNSLLASRLGVAPGMPLNFLAALTTFLLDVVIR